MLSKTIVKFFLIGGIIFMSPYLSIAQLNGTAVIRGIVVNDQHQPLPGISIVIKNTKQGTVSDSLGNFKLFINQSLPLRLILSGIGFEEKELEIKASGQNLQVQLFNQAVYANEVVVTASRQAEKLLQSPVTIEKLDLRALKETPSASFYDAIGNVKGVQLTTSSLTFKVPNTRGFNVPNNFRFMQLVDGVDVQAATLGVPLGNAIGPTPLDIQSLEITPGASSALYGMNAINGMSNLITKNPFRYQGLSISQQTGINHVDGKGKSPGLFTETAARFAKSFNNRLAFKLNASYLKGTDWVADNTNDFDPQALANPSFPTLSGANNPAYDGVNSYGNETNITISSNGKKYTVRRTGYAEKDLTDYAVQNLKLDAAVHYKLDSSTEISYSYRYGTMDGVFQRGNRIQLKGANVQNHKIEISNQDFLLRAYVSIENSGRSYAMKPLADNLELSFKSNAQWAQDYTAALNAAVNGGADLASAHKQARTAADNGRFIPGTPAFDAQVKKIINVNDWDIYPTSTNPANTTGGAALWTRSRFYNAEGTWSFNRSIHWMEVLAGVDYRLYDLIPDGNSFVDFTKELKDRNTPGGKDIYYGKFGGFVQAAKKLFDDKLKLTASLRFDKNQEFSPKLNPRFSAVYTWNRVHHFRASWQNGFRFPSLFEAYSFVNNGGVRRVGGLPIVERGLDYYSNSALASSITAFTTRVNTLLNTTPGLSQTDAMLQAKDLLKVSNPKSIRPEQISSFEVGYKASLLNNRLFVDAEAYFNAYKYFIGQLEITVPKKGSVSNFNDTVVLKSLYANSQVSRYRVQVNSLSKVRNYGFAAAVSYLFSHAYSVSANVNLNKLAKTDKNDPLIPGFNTPDWAANLSFGNGSVTKNLGFNIVWHWQDAFYWENLFGNGTVSAYGTIDAQLTLHLPGIKSSIKFGGTDIIDHRYYQYIGGPQIGALYYITWTADDLLR